MFTSLLLQIVTVISGFILPRLILTTYGPSIHGLVTSITQFLQYISLVDGGLNTVIRASLYKPLANKDYEQVSRVLKAAQKFFNKIGKIFILYIILLCIIYPHFIVTEFNSFYTILLIIILSFGTLLQYFFGISNQLLLQSDQKFYVISLSQIMFIIINLLLTVILIKFDANIHVVKLLSTLIFILRPIFYHYYVIKQYPINKNIEPDNNALAQRWDGFGQHVAYFINRNIDVTLITIFLGVNEVSVYSIYYMITFGIGSLFTSINSGISASFGNLLATKDKHYAYNSFKVYETLYYQLAVIMYIVTYFRIFSFIDLYTVGVNNIDYIRPAFATIFIFSEFINVIRLPYEMIILAEGHIKQMNIYGILEATINIVISLILVKPFGIVGIAIGTLIATLFRIISFILYLKNNIFNNYSYSHLFKLISANISIFILISFIMNKFSNDVINYFQWIYQSMMIFIVVFALISIVYYILNIKLYNKLFFHFIRTIRKLKFNL